MWTAPCLQLRMCVSEGMYIKIMLVCEEGKDSIIVSVGDTTPCGKTTETIEAEKSTFVYISDTWIFAMNNRP